MNFENKLLKGLKTANNYARTENNALTNASTTNALLDFFSMGGALRSRLDDEVIQLFDRAFSENPLLALKAAFYFRDIRGGQGERKVFRTLLRHLGNRYFDVVKRNISNVPLFGRWDDLYSLVGTPAENVMFDFVKRQLNEDVRAENPSLLAKWLKSENASSRQSKALARLTQKKLVLKSKEYRKILSSLRNKIRIVETEMCKNQWNEIQYDKLPSKAGSQYSKAFRRHDEERYKTYLESVKKGEKKINVKMLYPYDILRKAIRENSEEATVMWDNMPDYTEGNEENSIVVCDVSGSMTGTRSNGGVEPILISTSLAMYFSERAKGPYKNYFITFSRHPKLQEIRGVTLEDRFRSCQNGLAENTDLIAVFKLILTTAISYHVSQEEMIQKIYIVSDMEFDNAVDNRTNFQYITDLYKQAGYEVPKLVFWNVESRHDQSPITINDQNVFLVSGCSPSIFKNLMKSKTTNAYDLMLEVLNSERYNSVVL